MSVPNLHLSASKPSLPQGRSSMMSQSSSRSPLTLRFQSRWEGLDSSILSQLAKAKSVLDCVQATKEPHEEIRSNFDSEQDLRDWLIFKGVNTSRWGVNSTQTRSVQSLLTELQDGSAVLVANEKYYTHDNPDTKTASNHQVNSVSKSIGRIDPLSNRLHSTGLLREENKQLNVTKFASQKGYQEPCVVRCVRVVRCRIKQKDERGRVKYLLESMQELGKSGQIRHRNLLLSAIVKKGESVYTTAKRNVVDELQCIGGDAEKNVPLSAVNAVRTQRKDKSQIIVEENESPSFPGLVTRYFLYTVDVVVSYKLPMPSFRTVEYSKSRYISVTHHWRWKTKQELEDILLAKAMMKQHSSHAMLTEKGDPQGLGETVVLYDIFERHFTPNISFAFLKAKLKQWGYSSSEVEIIFANATAAAKKVTNGSSLVNEKTERIEPAASPEEEKAEETHRSQDNAITFLSSKEVSRKDLEAFFVPILNTMYIADKEKLFNELDEAKREEHFQVLLRLFPRCSRIFPKLLHGGFSGSYVLQVQGITPGDDAELTVVKLDQRHRMMSELNNYYDLYEYMGDCAPEVLEYDVEPDERFTVGGLKFELVGAVWMLPEFRHSNGSDAQLLNTFKTLFLHELNREAFAMKEHLRGRLGVSQLQLKRRRSSFNNQSGAYSLRRASTHSVSSTTSKLATIPSRTRNTVLKNRYITQIGELAENDATDERDLQDPSQENQQQREEEEKEDNESVFDSSCDDQSNDEQDEGQDDDEEEDDIDMFASDYAESDSDEEEVLVFGTVPQVLKEVFGEIMRNTTLASCEMLQTSLIVEYRIVDLLEREVLWSKDGYAKRRQEENDKGDVTNNRLNVLDFPGGKDIQNECEKLVRLLKITGQGKAEHSYAEGLLHADLNGQNILIDSHDIVWVIDFACSSVGHVLKDIIKLESCILFEYLKPATDADIELMKKMLSALIHCEDLREKVFCETFDKILQVENTSNETEKSDPNRKEQEGTAEDDSETVVGVSGQKEVESNFRAKARFAWEAIKLLRMYAGNYCSEDPEPLQMVIAMLHFALRALHYDDIPEKRALLFTVEECVKVLNTSLETLGTVKAQVDLEAAPDNNVDLMNKNLTPKQLEYEKDRYFHDIRVRKSYILDVITLERIQLSEQTVELQLVDGSFRDHIFYNNADIDEILAQKRLQQRLDALEGVINNTSGRFVSSGPDNTAARYRSAMQVLGDHRRTAHRVLLGGAASGKSCLLLKILLSTVQNQTGSDDDIIPILIPVINLGRFLSKTLSWTTEDDLADMYLEDVYGKGSARLAFLRVVRKEGRILWLFDGLDEGGDHKALIESYIATLSKTETRITISSRETGFNDAAFKEFTFYQVLPLTLEMQTQIIESKVGKLHPKVGQIKEELRKPQYAEIVRNPLMLTLMISLLKRTMTQDPNTSDDAFLTPALADTEDGSEVERNKFSRAFLYQCALDQLLHQSSMNKFGNRRGMNDKIMETSTKILASKLCKDFLKYLAFMVHKDRKRDFNPLFANRLVEGHSVDPVYFSPTEDGTAEEDVEKSLIDMVNTLHEAVLEGRCGLFAQSKVVSQSHHHVGRRRPPTRDKQMSPARAKMTGKLNMQEQVSAVDYIMRFVHLSFQEYLAALYLVDQLSAVCPASLAECQDRTKLLKLESRMEELGFVERGKGKGAITHDPWWQAVIMSVTASMSGNLLFAFSSILLREDDPAGANLFLCAEMLKEFRWAPAEKSFRDALNKLMKAGFDQYVQEVDLIRAVMHPSCHLQHLALNQFRRFSDPTRVAMGIAFGPDYQLESLDLNSTPLGESDFLQTSPWYIKVAAAQALGFIPEVKADKRIIAALLELWVDESPVVQKAAVEAIKTLGAENNRLVIDEVLRQIKDEIETSNGHELILALGLQNTLIIDELLMQTVSGSEFATLAIQTLRQIPLSEEFIDLLCRAISHSTSATIRRHAAELLLQNDHVKRVSLPPTVDIAFSKWIEEEDEPELVAKACETVQVLRVWSTGVKHALQNLVRERTFQGESLPREQVVVWQAAVSALAMMPGNLHADWFHQVVLHGSEDHHPAVRCQAVRLLGEILRHSSETDQVLTSRRRVPQPPPTKVNRLGKQDDLGNQESNEDNRDIKAGLHTAGRDLSPQGTGRPSKKSDFLDRLVALFQSDAAMVVRQSALHVLHRLPEVQDSFFVEVLTSSQVYPLRLREIATEALFQRAVACAPENLKSNLIHVGGIFADLAQEDDPFSFQALRWLSSVCTHLGKRDEVDHDEAALSERLVAILSEAMEAPLSKVDQPVKLSYISALEPELGALRDVLPLDLSQTILAKFSSAYLTYVKRAGAPEATRKQWTQVLLNFGKEGWRVTRAEPWLQCFQEADCTFRIGLVAVLPEAPTEFEAVKSALAQAMASGTSSAFLREACLRALAERNGLEDSEARLALKKWVCGGYEQSTFHALEAILQNGIVCPFVKSLIPLVLEDKATALFPTGLSRRNTRERISWNLVQSMKQQKGQQQTDSKSLEEKIQIKVTLHERIARTAKQLIMYPDMVYDEADLLKLLSNEPTSQLIACTALTKKTCVEKTEKVAFRLFELMSSYYSKPNKTPLSSRPVEFVATDAAELSPAEVVPVLAASVLVHHFKRTVSGSNAMQAYVLHDNAMMRLAACSCLSQKLESQTLLLIRQQAVSATEDPLVRKACINLLFDWFHWVRGYGSRAEEEMTNLELFEKILSSLLDQCADVKAHEEEPLFTVFLRRLKEANVSFEKKEVDKLFAIANNNTFTSIRQLASQVLSVLKLKQLPCVEDFTDLECVSKTSKLAWLALVKNILQLNTRTRRIGVLETKDARPRHTSTGTLTLAPFLEKQMLDVMSLSNEEQMIDEDVLKATLEFAKQHKVPLQVGTFENLLPLLSKKSKSNSAILACLDYLLVSPSIHLTKSLVRLLADLVTKDRDGPPLTKENGRSLAAISFFYSYPVKNYDEACALMDMMRDQNIACFLFDCVLNFFRTQRAYHRDPKVRWTVPEHVQTKLDSIIRETPQCLELSYLSKEMRLEFEVLESKGSTVHKLSLKSRADIQQQRDQRKEQLQMLEEEWNQQRVKWFPPSLVEDKLEKRSVPEHCRYQLSRVNISSLNFYINLIPDEMRIELDVVSQLVFVEVNRRLVAMGVLVEVAPLNPMLLDAGMAAFVDHPSFEPHEKDSIERRLEAVQATAPFMVSFVGERYGSIIKDNKYSSPSNMDDSSESIVSLERKEGYLKHMMLPTHALCYFRDLSGLDPTLPQDVQKQYRWEAFGDLKLRAKFDEHKKDIRSHAFAKASEFSMPLFGKVNGLESVVGTPEQEEAAHKLLNLVADDVFLKVLNEFRPVKGHKVSLKSRFEYRFPEIVEQLPFALHEEQRFHERCLVSHSFLPRTKDTFVGKTPRCRRETFIMLDNLVQLDVERENELRHERKTVTEKVFRTKDEDLGNDVILVMGKAGLGKTSFLATFAELLRFSGSTRVPLVLFHSCGVSATSKDLCFTLLRLGVELLEAFSKTVKVEDIAPPEGDEIDLQSVRSWWHKVLASTSSVAISLHKRPVIILDNFLDFSDVGFMTPKELWETLLPERFSHRVPPGMSIIISCNDSSSSLAVLEGGATSLHARKLHLQNLGRDERLSIVHFQAAKFGLSPSPNQCDAIINKRSSGNPLFLSLLVHTICSCSSGFTCEKELLDFIADFPDDMGAGKKAAGLLKALEPSPSTESLQSRSTRKLSTVSFSGSFASPTGSFICFPRGELLPSPNRSTRSPVSPLISRIEAAVGQHLAKLGLLCLSLAGSIEECSMFDVCCLVEPNISSRRWTWFCLLLEPLIQCVPVYAPPHIPVQNEAVHDLHKERKTSRARKLRRFLRFASPSDDVTSAMNVNKESVRIISFRHVWLRDAVLSHYLAQEPDGSSGSKYSTTGLLSKVHAKLAEHWVYRLREWYDGPEEKLPGHLLHAFRSIVPHALHSDDICSAVSGFFFDAKALSGFCALTSYFPAVKMLKDLLASTIAVLDASSPDINQSLECASKLRVILQRLQQPDFSNLSTDPTLATALCTNLN